MASDSDDDDVIFCGEESVIPEDKSQQQNSFLQHFQLCKNIPTEDVKPSKALSPLKRTAQATSTGINNNNTIFSNKNSFVNSQDSDPAKKVKRPPRRTPGVMVLLKNQIPITSPAGQRLIAQANAPITDEYVSERIERYERFCAAPPLALDNSNRPKFMDKKPIAYNNSTFRSNTKHFHNYKFPRRQFSTKARSDAVALLERIQMQQTKCKLVRIRVQRLSLKEIEDIKTQVRSKRRRTIPTTIAPEAVVDIIDLCSSADESSEDESDMNHTNSETSSSSTKVGRRPHTVRPPQQTLLFVDCSLPAENFLSVEPRLQLTASRSQYTSGTNLLAKQKQTAKLFATARRSDDLQMQQDKENRIHSYINEQSNNRSQALLFDRDELDMESPIMSTALSSSNQISIDLTM